MSAMTTSDSRQLPLHQKHLERFAKMGHFGQWEVPLYYTTILEEHDAVRQKAGLFEISHMGKFYLEGSAAEAFLEALLPRSIAAMKSGQALYMPLLNPAGGFIDDIIVYRIAADRFFIIANAGNLEKDREWILARKQVFASKLSPESSLRFQDLSDEQGLLALQGPLAAEILEEAFPGNSFLKLSYYSFALWRGGMVARTGYTGEDGFEIMVPLNILTEVWDKLMACGASRGLVPVGFGARDTLRLEAGMPLYGHDMNDEITPLEAGFSWTIDFAKPEFLGRQPLAEQKEAGIKKKMVGFEMLDRGIPRQDYEVRFAGSACGKVTSGSYSPTLKKNIGMAYVPVQYAAPGTEIEVMIRDRAQKAVIVKLPFYKRSKS